MRISVAIATALIAKTVAHDVDSRRRPLVGVALVTTERAMTTLEGVAGEPLMHESRDLEVEGGMAEVARSLRFTQAKLPAVTVVVAAVTGSRRKPVAGTFTGFSVCFRGAVTGATGGRSVRTG